MLRGLDDLLGLRLHAIDGELGHVHDFYFDDHHWTVRYLVVDTRQWLPGRRVLLSPASVRGTDRSAPELTVTLSREQIRQSPGVDTDKPVGRQNAPLFRECYSLPYYWAVGGYLWARGPALQEYGGGSRLTRSANGDPHLRSTRLVRGYAIRAVDGDVGHVEGFLIDDVSWALRYVVVGTSRRHWAAGKRVLIPTDWIAWVSWIELAVHVDLRRQPAVNAPAYDPSHPVTAEDEARLLALYGRPPRSRQSAHIA
jgi:hypothetical protein